MRFQQLSRSPDRSPTRQFLQDLPLRSRVHCELEKLTSRLCPLPLLFGLRLAADLAWSDGILLSIRATPQAVLILPARKDDIGRVASRRRGADCVSTRPMPRC